jgi:hypothetical protein
MTKGKRNRFQLWGVTFLWMVLVRTALILVVSVTLGVTIFSQHPHDPAAIRAAAPQMAAITTSLLTKINWALRLCIVVLARYGLLPGTGFPETEPTIADAFGDRPAVAARRIEPEVAPLPGSPMRPRTFGRRQSV